MEEINYLVGIIVCVGILYLCIEYYFSKPKSVEGLTTNEAVQNLSSVYNTSQMTSNNLNILQNGNIGGNLAVKGAITGGSITGSTVTSSGLLNAGAGLNVKGTSNLGTLYENAIVANVSTWSDAAFVSWVATNRVFNSSMPDGTLATGIDSFSFKGIPDPTTNTTTNSDTRGNIV